MRSVTLLDLQVTTARVFYLTNAGYGITYSPCVRINMIPLDLRGYW